ncbi:hypothetical protein HDU97_001413 [Phlyctochytrium planicorne]|nr:hypothetical protein HDU97_001413 [Phlyctochytrium planicorne]
MYLAILGIVVVFVICIVGVGALIRRVRKSKNKVGVAADPRKLEKGEGKGSISRNNMDVDTPSIYSVESEESFDVAVVDQLPDKNIVSPPGPDKKAMTYLQFQDPFHHLDIDITLKTIVEEDEDQDFHDDDFETRHPVTWTKEEVYAFLRRKNVDSCICGLLMEHPYVDGQRLLVLDGYHLGILRLEKKATEHLLNVVESLRVEWEIEV